MFKSTPPPAASRERDPEARRARLLAAAVQIFARDGFEKASLRQICLKANVNVAGVKYYFGSKEDLYREVLIESHRQALAQETPVRLTEGEDPEVTLRRWIFFCLRFLLSKKVNNPVLGQLMAHEMRQPTPCLSEFLKLVVRPFHQDLYRIVAAVLKQPEVTPEIAQLGHHIVGLCVHYDHGRVVIERLGMSVPKTEPEIQRLANGIADFVIFGLAGQRAKATA